MEVFFVWKYEYQGDSHHAIYTRREDAEAHVAEFERQHPLEHMHVDVFDLLTEFNPTNVIEE